VSPPFSIGFQHRYVWRDILSLQAIYFVRGLMRREIEVGVLNFGLLARTTFYPCRRRAGHHIPHAQSAGTSPVTCAAHLEERLPAEVARLCYGHADLLSLPRRSPRLERHHVTTGLNTSLLV